MGAHVSVPMYRRTLPQRLALEGGRCAVCSKALFPPTDSCPACGGTLEPFRLSGRGTIVALTQITAAGAPPEFSEEARRSGSYYVAIIALTEGPMITAQLVGFDRQPTHGAKVMGIIRKLYNEEAVQRYSFKFQPEGAQP